MVNPEIPKLQLTPIDNYQQDHRLLDILNSRHSMNAARSVLSMARVPPVAGPSSLLNSFSRLAIQQTRSFAASSSQSATMNQGQLMSHSPLFSLTHRVQLPEDAEDVQSHCLNHRCWSNVSRKRQSSLKFTPRNRRNPTRLYEKSAESSCRRARARLRTCLEKATTCRNIALCSSEGEGPRICLVLGAFGAVH